MIYLIDTNVISAVRRPDKAPQVAVWLRARAESDLFLSVITIGEIERGLWRQQRRDTGFAADLGAWLERTMKIFADRILPFGVEEARIWGRLSAEIGHGGADLMIAATALRHDAVVVTGKTADFSAAGVRLENPF